MENHVVIESKGRLAAIRNWMEPVLVLLILGSLFGYLGSQMGLSAMVNTLFNTAHQLLLKPDYQLALLDGYAGHHLLLDDVRLKLRTGGA